MSPSKARSASCGGPALIPHSSKSSGAGPLSHCQQANFCGQERTPVPVSGVRKEDNPGAKLHSSSQHKGQGGGGGRDL